MKNERLYCHGDTGPLLLSPAAHHSRGHGERGEGEEEHRHRLHPAVYGAARPEGAGAVPQVQKAGLALVFRPDGGDTACVFHRANVPEPGLDDALGGRGARAVFRAVRALQRAAPGAQKAGGLVDALHGRGGGGPRREAGGAGKALFALAVYPAAHHFARAMRFGDALGKRGRALGRAYPRRYLCALLSHEHFLLPAGVPAEAGRGGFGQPCERGADPRAALQLGQGVDGPGLALGAPGRGAVDIPGERAGVYGLHAALHAADTLYLPKGGVRGAAGAGAAHARERPGLCGRGRVLALGHGVLQPERPARDDKRPHGHGHEHEPRAARGEGGNGPVRAAAHRLSAGIQPVVHCRGLHAPRGADRGRDAVLRACHGEVRDSA